MNTYPIKDAQGQEHAIEIENAYASTRRIAHLISTVEGVTDVQLRKPFSGSGDVRATFRFHGDDFVITEPFGDSSRYWIGPANGTIGARDLGAIDACLRKYRSAILRKIWGDVLSLNFRPLFGG